MAPGRQCCPLKNKKKKRIKNRLISSDGSLSLVAENRPLDDVLWTDDDVAMSWRSCSGVTRLIDRKDELNFIQIGNGDYEHSIRFAVYALGNFDERHGLYTMSDYPLGSVCSSTGSADDGKASLPPTVGMKRPGSGSSGGGSAVQSTSDADSSSQPACEGALSTTKTRKLTAEHTVSCSTKLWTDLSFKKNPEKFHLLIGCTGSVASMKLPELVGEVQRACRAYQDRMEVRVVATDKALLFFDPSTLETPLFTDADEWSSWKGRGDPILHIELRRWADVMVIAPLDANTLSKIANGLCDNLLTCVVRAWDPSKPLYVCPAMNTFMWEHPLTYKHMEVLKNLLGFKDIPCIDKELMCGERGYGAMASVPMIASVIASEINKHFAIFTG